MFEFSESERTRSTGRFQFRSRPAAGASIDEIVEHGRASAPAVVEHGCEQPRCVLPGRCRDARLPCVAEFGLQSLGLDGVLQQCAGAGQQRITGGLRDLGDDLVRQPLGARCRCTDHAGQLEAALEVEVLRVALADAKPPAGRLQQQEPRGRGLQVDARSIDPCPQLCGGIRGQRTARETRILCGPDHERVEDELERPRQRATRAVAQRSHRRTQRLPGLRDRARAGTSATSLVGAVLEGIPMTVSP